MPIKRPPIQKGPNLLRLDPTRTAAIRRQFLAQVHIRFRRLRQDIRNLVLKEDAFALKPQPSGGHFVSNLQAMEQVLNAFCPTGEGGGIDPSCSPSGGGGGESGGSIEFKVSMSDRLKIKQHFDKFDVDDIPSLMGAQPGAKVTVSEVQIDGSLSRIHIGIEHPLYHASRTIHDNYIHNSSIALKEGVPKGTGIGTKIFHDQVTAAAAHGFDRIETLASRGGATVNGYYTWARLGYDKNLGMTFSEESAKSFPLKDVKLAVPEHGTFLAGRFKISDLMKTQEGRDWWKEYGKSWEGTFDLKAGSLSRRILDGYVKETGKGASRTTSNSNSERGGDSGLDLGQGEVANAFCPTGAGGGVDPSCSPGKYGLPKSSAEDQAPGGKYYYRGTNPKNLKAIAEQGIVPSPYADGISVAPHLESALFWASAATGGGDVALMRFPRGTVRMKHPEDYDEENTTAETVTQRKVTIPPDKLEVYQGGAWHPLKPTANAFCPTGEGGGVDPSCGPGSSSKPGLKKHTDQAEKSAQRAAETFGLDHKPVKFGTDDSGRVYGEHSSDAPSVVNPEQGLTRPIDINFKTAPGVTTIDHVAAHETVHRAYSKDSELGAEIANRLAKIKGPYGSAVSVYGSFEGKFENAIELGAVYSHSPEQLKTFSPEMHELAKEWATRLKTTTTNTRFKFHSTSDKVHEFRTWLANRLHYHIIGTMAREIENAWWRQYVEEGYRKGAGRAFEDTRQPRTADRRRLDFYRGTKEEFLRSSFAHPVAIDKVKLLAGRVYSELSGVTQQMGQKMARELADGLTEGKSPHEVADDLDDELDIGEARAETIARTETIRAHAEGQLDALEDLGVTSVGVMVEWSTTGDGLVCEECEPLEGVVLSIDEAHGMIPRHPNCRCAWIPANVGESDKDQTRDKGDIDDALDESIDAGSSKGTLDEKYDKSTWAGADVDIAEDRPQGIFSVNASFSSTHVEVRDRSVAAVIREIQEGLDPADVIELEDDPHVTVLYGLHSQDPEPIRHRIERAGTVFARLGKLSLFRSPEQDVLKFDVYSNDLARMNRELGLLPHTETFRNYHPHLTIAYLKPGTGEKYLQPTSIQGMDLRLSDLTFSNKNKEQTRIALNAFCPTGKGGGVDPSCSPGGGAGGLKPALDSLLKHTGFTKDQLKQGLLTDPKMRAVVTGSLLRSGLATKNAVLKVENGDKARISKITQGDPAEAHKQFAETPKYDLAVLNKITIKNTALAGEAVANMASGHITTGSTTRPGSFRHELGHVIHGSYGFGKNNTVNTKIKEEYQNVMKKVKANPKGLAQKQAHEWYEANYGVAGRRSLDNEKENFAEHYRLYHREIYRDQHEGGQGKYLEGYRQRHPGMAALFDAHYTAGLLHQELNQ